VKVVESLVPLGLATPEEVERIRSDKARRAEFRQVPLEEIKLYTTLELRMLSIAATVLRDGFDRMGIRLNSWMGAGAAASALLKKEGVSRHYAGFVRKYNISEEQRIAHAGFYGARIELTKQGLSDGIGYDQRSAYPYVCLGLPSMIGGRFRREEMPSWNEIENASPLSEFFIQWNLPEVYIDETGEARNFLFYPLPFRLPGGGILFPLKGSGWYFRDDAIAAKRWLEKFASLGAAVSKDGLAIPISAKAATRMKLSADDRIALGQCTRAIIGMGLDACMGFLHSPKPGRLSFSYDALELHRARLTRAVFNYVQGRAFKRGDFQLSPEGIVRLSPLVAKEVVALVLKEISFKDYVAGTRKIVKWF
jgi:hypothetical protein